MGILNLNGIERKNAKPIKGHIFTPQLAALQHPTVGFFGKTYNSPFTQSNKPVFPVGTNVATQPQLPPLKVESPGTVVPLDDFVKVHPNEKGSTFATNRSARPVDFRNGGPSKTADTPANPNAPKLKRQPRPQRAGSQTPVEKQSHLSFIRSGGTLSAHSNKDSFTSRWAVSKKGAVVA